MHSWVKPLLLRALNFKTQLTQPVYQNITNIRKVQDKLAPLFLPSPRTVNFPHIPLTIEMYINGFCFFHNGCFKTAKDFLVSNFMFEKCKTKGIAGTFPSENSLCLT